MFSAFNPSKWSSGQPTLQRPESSLGFGALGSHLSCGHFLPEPGFEPTTLGFKSNALSIRPRLLRHCLVYGLASQTLAYAIVGHGEPFRCASLSFSFVTL